MDTVDRWLATRTFEHRQFTDIAALVRRKEKLGLTLSLCIPTLNEAATIGAVVACLRAALRDHLPLLDEIAVIDSGSTDRTVELAVAAGAEVYRAADILPEMGPGQGKGENLWKALYQLKGDILVGVDGDITNIHPGFVAGLVGPLLHQRDIGYVKAFYGRACRTRESGAPCGGGRVTEILIRPLFSLYYPQLTGLIQPLAGEFAARRSLVERLAHPLGYGIETAHLIDLYTDHGLDIFAQTDMGHRGHRVRSNEELGRMAFAILQVVNRRLHRRGMVAALPEDAHHLHQFAGAEGCYRRVCSRIVEQERPPMVEIAAYRRRWRRPVQPGLRPMDSGVQHAAAGVGR